MNAHLIFKALANISAAVFIAGCASQTPPKESGFLSNYSALVKEDAPGGGSRLVYRDPSAKSTQYTAVWLDRVQFYPQPQPSEKVSAATLSEIQEYTDTTLRRKVGNSVRLAQGPGPGVAHWQIAITAVGSQSQALKVYQYIPIALAITGAKALAEGGRPQEASIAFENKVTDSMTNRMLFESVRGGTGEKAIALTQGKAVVTADDLKPLIDQWTDSVAQELRQYMQGRP